MPRTVKLGAFNIVTHPHSPANYLELFKQGRLLRQPIKVWGETYGILASVYHPLGTENSTVITGEVFTFLQLDASLNWFDIIRGEEATDAQVDQVKIPTELRPHLRKIRYVLFPEDHLFVYTVEDATYGAISPTPMKNFLERLLNDNRLLEKTKFQLVDVRLVQDRKALTAILKTVTLERLEIMVRRPNPGDTPGDAEQMVEQEMMEEELEELEIIKKASKEGGIKPNKRTLQYMEAAETNGYVKAKGISKNGEKREFNTQLSPLIEPFEFSNAAGYLDRFLDAARELRNIIRRKRK